MYKFISGVGFAGCMHSGKDTAAGYLKDSIIQLMGATYKVTTLALAQPIKQFAMDYLGLNKHQCYDQEGKAEYNTFWGMTNREILQKIGTDAMRNGFHPDVWVKITELRIKKSIKEGSFWIVTDVRFPNECEMIRRCGGIVVSMMRPSVEPTVPLDQVHPSELKLHSDMIDYLLRNDGTLDDLKQNVDLLKAYIIGNNYRANYDAQYKG